MSERSSFLTRSVGRRVQVHTKAEKFRSGQLVEVSDAELVLFDRGAHYCIPRSRVDLVEVYPL